MPNRKFSRPTEGGHTLKIGGKLVNILLARIVYKCEECHGDLKRVDMGLKCIANPNHRGFIHRDEAEAIQARQAKNVEQLEQVYEIVDGKVTVKCQSKE